MNNSPKKLKKLNQHPSWAQQSRMESKLCLQDVFHVTFLFYTLSLFVEDGSLHKQRTVCKVWTGTMTDAASRPLPGLPPGSPVPISRSPTMSPSLFQQTPRDTIARSFCPVVAIAASQDANDACRANNLGSFVDLIQPFGDLIEGRGSVPFSGT